MTRLWRFLLMMHMSSFYKIAWPVFRDNEIPVTLFVSTDIIDKKTKGYMTWEEIKTFIDEGGSVGQHTSSHLHMPLNNFGNKKRYFKFS